MTAASAIDNVQKQIEKLENNDKKLATTMKPYSKVFIDEVDTVQLGFLTLRSSTDDQRAESFLDQSEAEISKDLLAIAQEGAQYLKLSRGNLGQESVAALKTVESLNQKLAAELMSIELELASLEKIQRVQIKLDALDNEKRTWEEKLKLRSLSSQDQLTEGETLLRKLHDIENELPPGESLKSAQLQEMLQDLLYEKDTLEDDVGQKYRLIMLKKDPSQYRQKIEEMVNAQLNFLITDDNLRETTKEKTLAEIWDVLDNSSGIAPEDVDRKIYDLIGNVTEKIPYTIKVKGTKGVYEFIYKPAPKPREIANMQIQASETIETYENFIATDGSNLIKQKVNPPQLSILNGVLTFKVEDKGKYTKIITITPGQVTINDSSDPEKDPRLAKTLLLRSAFEKWQNSGDDSTILIFGDPPQKIDLKKFMSNPPIRKDQLTLFAVTEQIAKFNDNPKNKYADNKTQGEVFLEQYLNGLEYDKADEVSGKRIPCQVTRVFQYKQTSLGNKRFKSKEEYHFENILTGATVTSIEYFNSKNQQIGTLVETFQLDEQNLANIQRHTTKNEFFGEGKNRLREERKYIDGLLTSQDRFDSKDIKIGSEVDDPSALVVFEGEDGEFITLGSYSREKKLNPSLTPDGYIKLLSGVLKDDVAYSQYIERILEYVEDEKLYGVEEYWDTVDEVIAHELHGRHRADCDGYIRPLEKALAYQGIKGYATGIYRHTEVIALFQDSKGKYHAKSYGTGGVHVDGIEVKDENIDIEALPGYDRPIDAIASLQQAIGKFDYNEKINGEVYYGLNNSLDGTVRMSILKNPAQYPFVNKLLKNSYHKNQHIAVNSFAINKNRPKKYKSTQVASKL